MSQQILVFGDSIAEGFWDVNGGWVEKLRRDMYRKMMSNSNFWCAVRNLSRSGDTTNDMLKRFSSETYARAGHSEDKPVIIFSIGINDSAYLHKIGNPRVSERVFQKNITKLIIAARRFTKKILFLAVTPVDEEKVYFKPWIGAFNYKNYYGNERIEEYNNTIENLCKKYMIYFLGVPKEFKAANYKKLLYDGLHPNSKGHELIFKSVLDFLYKRNLIKGES